ncbi:hypothetical protein FVEN_g219 [Fusarium venenatum]|uniref:Secreted LysM effector LysM C-terminal domain-containing protein n=1 Tax=Fusarium venenatum TaxID=56646 RepID=A0A2L2SYU6_9HYPO|nr:uncharacterized protein FVRRES_07678 [Fusarium venenatum]KAG8361855.1 hypothetical protein FVEN_g219 [Fusarium venenatum]KAH6994577.1 hypothetical protein EDB82DRAFT_575997 [Fusarium venenatum]CEI63242.1 unnamed protein product [Fusarium venenatum]
MKFSITKLITLLAVTQNASAWFVRFMNEDNNCEVGGETEYQIFTGEKFDCYNFGASLNEGTECEHFRQGGGEKLWECKGTFVAKSAITKPGTGSNCRFYALNDCSGVGTNGDRDTCVPVSQMIGDGSSIPQRIVSFRCENTEEPA